MKIRKNDLLRRLRDEEMNCYMSLNNDNLNDRQVEIVSNRKDNIRNRIERLEKIDDEFVEIDG